MSDVERDIHGHKVYADEALKKGLDYLDYTLGYAEAQVFFQQAQYKGKVQFEDDQHRNYTLIRNKNATYTLQARKESKGFWSGWF